MTTFRYRSRRSVVHVAALLGILLAMVGCGATGLKRSIGPGSDALKRLASALPGDYDNHDQAAAAVDRKPAGTIAPLRVLHSLRVVPAGRDDLAWLWQIQAASHDDTVVWLMRAQIHADGRHVRLIPSRPLDPATARAAVADPAAFRYEPGQWVDLDPCAEVGEWTQDVFAAAATAETCQAVLPGLGDSAARLPLRISIEGDQLRVATFADLALGSEAIEQARRVRWFVGWAAINGGGPAAKANNQDWHLQHDLRLSSEGGRAALRWRDGTASGYLLELERTRYAERNQSVLRLNVIDETSGKTLTYAWSDATADSIGINLGWLQVGLLREAAVGH